MKKAGAAILVCALLATGCVSQPLEPIAVPVSQEPSKSEFAKDGPGALAVATGAGKGALQGARVCAVPTAIGAFGGPIGLIIGGAISLVCLPVGVTLGAIAGAANVAFPGNGEQSLETEPRI